MKIAEENSLQLLNPMLHPVDDSQWVFRQLLKVMSEPGTCVPILQTNDNYDVFNGLLSRIYATTWMLAQTLLDHDCQVYVSPELSEPAFIQSLGFYTDCRLVNQAELADFVFMSINEFQQLDNVNQGSVEAPHQSATVIVQSGEIDSQPSSQSSVVLEISGPGIKGNRPLLIESLTEQQVQLLQDNHLNYPCGLDFVFCSPELITALPRTTKVTLPIEEMV